MLILAKLMVHMCGLRFFVLFVEHTPAQGIYLLSMLLQLCTLFLPALDGGYAGILSALPAYETSGSVFDCSFLASAGLGAVVKWMRGQAWEL